MYENEYNNNNVTNTQNPYVAPPQNMYRDFGSYGPGPDQAGQPGGFQPTAPRRKRGGAVAACIALTLAGLLIGGGIASAYFVGPGLVNRITGKVTENAKEAEGEEAKPEQKDPVTLAKSDDKTEATVASDLPTTSSGAVLDTAGIAEIGLPSIVAITNYSVTEIRSFWGEIYKQDSMGAGSGVIIGQTDDELLILTNYHVVENNQSLSVVFSWEENAEDIDEDSIIYATVKDYDADRDIAVISIRNEDLSDEVLSRISVATVGSSDDLKLGEQVVAIGNALGYGQSVTTGIVSALNRKIQDEQTDDNVYIQTDAAINPGNSGGALFNMKGELVGINTAMIGGTTVENMGYAIPISDITDEVENMMNQESREVVKEEDRGYLGVSIVEVSSDISKVYGIPEGVYVSSVDEGSGAEKAGIEKEDIIVAVNDRSTTTSSELREYLDRYSVGETVTITLLRDTGSEYEEMEVDVKLGPAK